VGRESLRGFVRAGGPDKIAIFAIRPGRADIGGYGGSSPRKTTAGYGGSSPRKKTVSGVMIVSRGQPCARTAGLLAAH